MVTITALTFAVRVSNVPRKEDGVEQLPHVEIAAAIQLEVVDYDDLHCDLLQPRYIPLRIEFLAV